MPKSESQALLGQEMLCGHLVEHMQSIKASALDPITAIRHGIAAQILDLFGQLLIIPSRFQELLSLPQNMRLDRSCGLMKIDSMAVNLRFCINEEIVSAVSPSSILRDISAGCFRMASCRPASACLLPLPWWLIQCQWRRPLAKQAVV
jgi:hypothetical protein